MKVTRIQADAARVREPFLAGGAAWKAKLFR